MFSGGKVYYDMKLTDVKTGKTVKKYRRRLCHSFVKQFAQILQLAMSTEVATITDTSNASCSVMKGAYSGYLLSCNAAAADASLGNVIGTGTTAVSINDYKIETQISHGTSGGQMQYGAQSFGAPTTDATSAYCVLTRVFTNGSGGSITVNEIGLYNIVNQISGSTAKKFCILHDILASPVTVANGQAMTLNYTIKVTL